jgi:hypothetical protein
MAGKLETNFNGRFCLLVVLFFSYAPPLFANSSDDAVSFFKRAITSPPDIESFKVRSKIIKLPPLPPRIAAKIGPRPNFSSTNFAEGARAGQNFYHRGVLADPRGEPDWDHPFSTIGRSDLEAYGFTSNSESHANTEHMAKSFHGVVSQYFNMGIGDLKPESVIWNGNEFTAVDSVNASLFGVLEITNGLPACLKISTEKGRPPFKSASFFYPTPIFLFGGFPEKITQNSLFDGDLEPSDEVVFLEVKVAEHPLGKEFFSREQFEIKHSVPAFNSSAIATPIAKNHLTTIHSSNSSHLLGALAFAGLLMGTVIFICHKIQKKNRLRT